MAPYYDGSIFFFNVRLGSIMKRLWAPWRMAYIVKSNRRGCFLCAMFRRRRDRANLVLKRGKTCALLMNRYPYNNGHLMVAPYRHVATLDAMKKQEAAELMALAALGCRALEKVLQPNGFNLGLNLGKAAGAGLKDHLHLHIVPRWAGDTNFMHVLGEVRVIPQPLDELWELLHKRLP